MNHDSSVSKVTYYGLDSWGSHSALIHYTQNSSGTQQSPLDRSS